MEKMGLGKRTIFRPARPSSSPKMVGREKIDYEGWQLELSKTAVTCEGIKRFLLSIQLRLKLIDAIVDI
ncbi:MAG: hypothetical protein ACLFVL_00035 [Candidatus Aenigmatarchaeota archaeon]